MSRRRKSQLDASLFPFLSVLCSLIGVFTLFLILILGSRTLGSSGGGGEEFDPDEIPPEAVRISEDEFQAYLRRIEILEGELRTRRRQRNELTARVDELEELLRAMLKKVADAGSNAGKITGVELGKPEDVEMTAVPGMAGIKKPRFVEVNRNGFIIHPEHTEFPREQLQDPNSPLIEFIRHMDEVREAEYLLFLVRPEGVDVFDEIHVYMRKNYRNDDGLTRIGIGWEPFSEAWVLLSKKSKP